ncbi:MAG: hypothetical protein ACQEQC_01420 [Elusimicrobiota bacterium]
MQCSFLDAYQVRNKNFNWEIAETPNLKVYHYTDKNDNFDLVSILKTLEYTHRHISSKLNTVFEKKTPVFIYKTHNHFKQNRIAAIGEGTEGFSELYKSRLVLPLRNSSYDMEHLIAHEYTHITQFELLYGGFWRSAKLIKGLSGLVPLWIMEGQAEHISHNILDRDWSAYDRMILRDAVLYDYLYNFRELQNFNPLFKDIYLGYKQGHSAIDYLVEEEGPEVNFKLLKSLRNNVDPVMAFEKATENFASLRDFNLKWKENLTKEVREFVSDKKKAEDIYDTKIDNNKYDVRNPVASGKEQFFYVSDVWGPSEIYKYTKDGKKEKVLQNFFGSQVDRLVTGRRYDKIIDFNSSSKILSFFAARNNKNYLFLYHTDSQELEKLSFTNLSEMRSPALNKDGDKIVFTAFKDGKRDIFIYDIAARNLVQVTNDKYMDYGPVFKNSDQKLLVSTERDYNTDLREIKIETGVGEWLTETPHNEIQPVIGPGKNIYYSSDKNSVFNIYVYGNNGSTQTAISDVSGGLFYPEILNEEEILFSSYFDRSYKLQSSSIPDRKSTHLSSYRYYDSVEAAGDFKINDIDYYPPEFNYSTDLFLPSFLYSTEVGFLGGGYYRGSDMLGHHNFDAYGWAWTGAYEVSGQYVLKKWRPDIFLSVLSDEQKYAFKNAAEELEIEREKRLRGTLGYSYPLNSNLSLSNWFQIEDKNIENITNDNTYVNYTDTGLGVGLTRNTSMLEPFKVYRGSIMDFSMLASGKWSKTDLKYNKYQTNVRKYLPLSHKFIWATKFNYSGNSGPDAGKFNLNLKGYDRKKDQGENRTAVTTELRYMVFPDLNWHFYFMWPDINIYSLSVKAFSEVGNCWDNSDFMDPKNDWAKSLGIGVKLNIYLLQQTPVYLNIDYARPYANRSWKTYVTFSSGYVTW